MAERTYAEIQRMTEITPAGTEDSVLSMRYANGYAYSIELLPHPEDVYTFSIWVKCKNDDTDETADLSIDIFGELRTFSISGNEWQQIVIKGVQSTGTEEENNILLIPFTDEILLFYRAMLEQGTNVSDWSVALEEISDQFGTLTKRITSAELKLIDESIVSTVRKSEEYANDIKETRTVVTQTAEGIEAQFDSYKENVSKYIRFSEAGIEIGEEGENASEFHSLFSKDRLSFYDGDDAVSYISNKAMSITDAVIVNSMRIGPFSFVPTDSGMAITYASEA